LPAIDYAPDDTVVTVLSNGIAKFKGRDIKVSNALRGMPIAFRHDDTQDGVYKLYFAHHRLTRIDMREAD
jgi:azurin